MKQDIDYKVPNGKLLRLEADIEGGAIKSIKISGDFFMYPETGVLNIEDALCGQKIDEKKRLINILEKLIKDKGIQIIGFTAADLVSALIQDTKVKIAIAQMDMSLGDKNTNLKKAEKFILQASKEKVDFICFPEYFSTGSCLEKAEELAESVPGETTTKLCAFAKKNKINIITSIFEKEKQKIYNTGIFIDSDGKISSKNRKIHLFLDEVEVVNSGEGCYVINTKQCKIGIMVCYDTIFPEVARKMALKQAKIIFIPANWPNPFISQWRLSTSARALDNQTWVVAVNRCGKDNMHTYFGRSRIIDPYGELAIECDESESLNIFEIDLKKSEEFKQIVNFIRDKKDIIGK